MALKEVHMGVSLLLDTPVTYRGQGKEGAGGAALLMPAKAEVQVKDPG